jgi:hypothetical protein
LDGLAAYRTGILLFMTAAAPFALYRFSLRTINMARMPEARLRFVAERRNQLHTVHLFTLSTDWKLTHQWGTNGTIYVAPRKPTPSVWREGPDPSPITSIDYGWPKVVVVYPKSATNPIASPWE